METTKSQEKQVLEELGKLLFLCYEGTDRSFSMPNKVEFIDVLHGLQALRLFIQYQRFDLEATRREIEYLKSLLGDK